MSRIKKCPCRTSSHDVYDFADGKKRWIIQTPFDGGWAYEEYPVKFCPECGAKLNEDGTLEKRKLLEDKIAKLEERLQKMSERLKK